MNKKSNRKPQKRNKRKDNGGMPAWARRLLEKIETQIQEQRKEIKIFKEELKTYKEQVQAYKEEVQAYKEEVKMLREESRQSIVKLKEELEEIGKMAREGIKLARKANQQIGHLTNKLGSYVEDFIFPSIVGFFRDTMEHVDEIIPPGLKINYDGEDFEFDGIIIGKFPGGKHAIVSAFIRSHITDKDFKEATEKYIQNFKKAFFTRHPEKANYSLYLAIGCIKMDKSVENNLKKYNVYIFYPSENIADCINPDIAPEDFN